jgi:hypothetical protein
MSQLTIMLSVTIMLNVTYTTFRLNVVMLWRQLNAYAERHN